MKSFIIWIVGTLLGAGTGYALSFLLDVNIFLLIFFGVILGSSVAITFNIHREKEEAPELPEPVEFEEDPETLI